MSSAPCFLPRFRSLLASCYLALLLLVSVQVNALEKISLEKTQNTKPTADIFDLGAPYFETVLQGNYELPTITDLAQGNDGRLWIGTYEGLYHYDGYQVKAADYIDETGQQLPRHWIRHITVDSEGKLWVGTAASGLYILDQQQRSFQHFQHQPQNNESLSSNSVNYIEIVDANHAWLGTTKGLDYFDLKQSSSLHYPQPERATRKTSAYVISALLEDKDGQIWIGSSNGIDVMPASGSLKNTKIKAMFRAEHHHNLQQQTITKIFQSQDGQLWFGSFGAGAFLLNKTGELKKLATDDWVRDIIELPNGEVWISTARSGIHVYKAETGQLIREHRHSQSSEASFDSDNAVSFLLDQSGLLWISTLGKGLSRINIANQFSRSLAHNPSDPRSLSHNDIYAIFEAQNGHIWFSTYGKGVDVFDPALGRIQSLKPNIGQAGAIQEGTIKAISQTQDGSMWLGGLNSGLYRLRPGQDTLEQLRVKDGLFSNKIFRLLPEDNGDLIIITRRGVNRFISKSETIEPIRNSEFSRTSSLYFKARLNNGDIWLASPTALYLLKKGSTELLPVAIPSTLRTHLSSNRILALHTLANEQLMMITQSAWYRLELDRDNSQVSAELAPNTEDFINVEAMVGPDGRHWGANFVFDFERGKTQFLSRADGVFHRIRRPMAATKTREGTFIFGGANGITLHKPTQFSTWSFEPQVLINSIEIDGKSQTGSLSQLTLPAQAHGFSVEFAALDFSAPNSLRYAYKLEGYDSHWNHTDSSRRLATYTNLNPGDYRLLIRASNRLGNWSPQQVRLAVTIEAAWFQSLWFRISLALLIASCLYLVYFLRIRQLERRRVVLEGLVSSRTQELQDSLHKLERTKDQLVASEKQASLGRLVRGMAHELNTPLGVVGMAASVLSDCTNNTIGHASQSQLNEQQAKKLLQKSNSAEGLLTKNLNRLNQLIGNFKLLASDEAEQKRERFDVRSHIEKVCASNAQKLKAAGISVIIEGPDSILLDSKPLALFQVLNELMNNAIEHAYTQLESGREKQLKIAYQEQQEDGQSWLEIAVIDNGQGIASQVVNTLFDPFVAANTQNVGLGLHASFNNVAQQLDGEISCSSEAGRGSRFEIKLPA